MVPKIGSICEVKFFKSEYGFAPNSFNIDISQATKYISMKLRTRFSSTPLYSVKIGHIG